MRVGFGIFAVICVMATPALAQQQHQRGGGLDRLLAMDSNGDGAITRAETDAARLTMFNRVDADGDGYITEAERAAMRQDNQRVRQGGRGDHGPADADGDGRISRVEATANPIRGFNRIDANRDGVLSAEEIQAVRSRMNAG